MRRLAWMAIFAAVLLAGRAVPAWAQSQTKVGTIKSVDAQARTFVLDREPRGLTFAVDDKTTITLGGKASSFVEAMKPELKASVTYTISGETRLASRVDVGSAPLAGIGAAATRPADAKLAGKPGEYVVTKSYKVGGEGLWENVMLDSDGKILYIPRNRRMQAMETATGKLVAEVPSKGAVRGVALVPAAGRGFFTSPQDNSVTVFDLKSYAVLGKIHVDGEPGAVLYDPSSKRVLVCCTEGKCLVPIAPDIDLKTGKPDTAIDLGGKPTGLVGDGQGSAYVDIPDADDIAVIDTKGMSLLTKWSMGNSNRPYGISMDAGHGRLFVGTRNMRLSVVSIVDGHEIAGVAIGGQIESTAYGAGKVFVACTDGSLRVVGMNAAGQYVVEQTIRIGGMLRTLAVDPKTGTVYVPTADFEAGRKAARDSFKIQVLERK